MKIDAISTKLAQTGHDVSARPRAQRPANDAKPSHAAPVRSGKDASRPEPARPGKVSTKA
jgi:hypothetical protein